MEQPCRTLSRSGRSHDVFSQSRDAVVLHSLIASLCVLFEDLRIEIAGQAATELRELDACGKTLRRLYFLRRSTATLHEFSTVLRELDRLPEFESIRSQFNRVAHVHWSRAVSYFQGKDEAIARLRHNVGGHFRRQGAKLALSGLNCDSVGTLEIDFYSNGAGAKHLFVGELLAVGMLRHVKGRTTAERSRRLVREVVVAYRKAAWAVDAIAATYLWDRFGK